MQGLARLAAVAAVLAVGTANDPNAADSKSPGATTGISIDKAAENQVFRRLETTNREEVVRREEMVKYTLKNGLFGSDDSEESGRGSDDGNTPGSDGDKDGIEVIADDEGLVLKLVKSLGGVLSNFVQFTFAQAKAYAAKNPKAPITNYSAPADFLLGAFVHVLAPNASRCGIDDSPIFSGLYYSPKRRLERGYYGDWMRYHTFNVTQQQIAAKLSNLGDYDLETPGSQWPVIHDFMAYVLDDADFCECMETFLNWAGDGDDEGEGSLSGLKNFVIASLKEHNNKISGLKPQGDQWYAPVEDLGSKLLQGTFRYLNNLDPEKFPLCKERALMRKYAEMSKRMRGFDGNPNDRDVALFAQHYGLLINITMYQGGNSRGRKLQPGNFGIPPHMVARHTHATICRLDLMGGDDACDSDSSADQSGDSSSSMI